MTIDAQMRGAQMAGMVWAAVTAEQTEHPRTVQSRENRLLGMSDLGGCREYMRSMLMHEEGQESLELKWPAMVGTLLGDAIEKIVSRRLGDEVLTQRVVTLTLTVDGTEIKITGSTDIIFLGQGVLDLKSKAELATVRGAGPTFKEKAQISGYLVAAIQEGLLDETAVGTLMYYDRSGRDKTWHEWTTDYENALLILEAVSNRVSDVMHAINSSKTAPRDEPESWCRAVGCAFYSNCWKGYTPSGAIEDQKTIDAVLDYVTARDDMKDASLRKESAREALMGNEGVTPDGTIVRWTETMTARGDQSFRLDVFRE